MATAKKVRTHRIFAVGEDPRATKRQLLEGRTQNGQTVRATEAAWRSPAIRRR